MWDNLPKQDGASRASSARSSAITGEDAIVERILPVPRAAAAQESPLADVQAPPAPAELLVGTAALRIAMGAVQSALGKQRKIDMIGLHGDQIGDYLGLSIASRVLDELVKRSEEVSPEEFVSVAQKHSLWPGPISYLAKVVGGIPFAEDVCVRLAAYCYEEYREGMLAMFLEGIRD